MLQSRDVLRKQCVADLDKILSATTHLDPRMRKILRDSYILNLDHIISYACAEHRSVQQHIWQIANILNTRPWSRRKNPRPLYPLVTKCPFSDGRLWCSALYRIKQRQYQIQIARIMERPPALAPEHRLCQVRPSHCGRFNEFKRRMEQNNMLPVNTK